MIVSKLSSHKIIIQILYTNSLNSSKIISSIHLQHQQTTITQSPDWEQLVQMNSSPRSSIRFKNINPQNSNFNNYKNSNFNGFVPSNSPSNNSNNLYISSSSSSNINVLDGTKRISDNGMNKLQHSTSYHLDKMGCTQLQSPSNNQLTAGSNNAIYNNKGRANYIKRAGNGRLDGFKTAVSRDTLFY